MSFRDYLDKKKKDEEEAVNKSAASSDSSGVNKFALDKYNNLMRDYNGYSDYVKSNSGYLDDDSYINRTKTLQSLDDRRNEIENYFSKSADSGSKTSKSITYGLNQMRSFSDNLNSYNNSERKYYEQWNTKSEYDTWKAKKDYEDSLKSMSADQLKTEQQRLETERNSYDSKRGSIFTSWLGKVGSDISQTMDINSGGQGNYDSTESDKYEENKALKAKVSDYDEKLKLVDTAIKENYYNSLKNNSDYAEKSAPGEASSDPIRKLTGVKDVIQYLNNGKSVNSTANTVYNTGMGKELSAYYNPLSYINSDEENTLRYIYNTQGEKPAQDYYDNYLSPILNKRQNSKETTDLSSYANEHPLIATGLSYGSNVTSGLSAPKDAYDAITGKGIDVNSPIHKSVNMTNTIRNTVSENYASKQFGGKSLPVIGNVGQFVYNTVNSSVDSAINGAIGYGIGSAVAGAASLGEVATKNLIGDATSMIMGSHVWSNGILQGKEKGYSDSKAVVIGGIQAAIEAATEKWSIENILDNPTTFLSKHVKNALARSFISEGSEEVAGNWLNNITDVLANGNKSDIMNTYKQYLYNGETKDEALRDTIWSLVENDAQSFLAGGISGVGLSATYGGINKAETAIDDSYRGAEIRNGGNIDTLKESASKLNNSGSNSELYKLAQQVADKGKETSDRQLGKLQRLSYDESQNQLSNRIESVVSDRLAALGENSSDASTITMKLLKGEELSKKEKSVVGGSMAIQRVVSEYNSQYGASAGMFSNDWTNDIYKNTSDEREVAKNIATSTAAKNSIIQNGKYDVHPLTVSDDGKTAIKETGEKVNISKLSDIKNNEAIVELDNGRVVPVSDLSLSSKDAVLYSAAGLMSSVRAANNLISEYKGGDVNDYVNKYLTAYDLVRRTGRTELVDGVIRGLDSDTKIKAVTFGLQDYKDDLEKDKSIAESVKNLKHVVIKSGKLAGISGRLTERQAASVRALQKLSNVVGVDFVVYQSEETKSGRIADTEIGKTSANGFYHDGKIYVDINSGNSGEGAVLRTASHELTHFIKEYSASMYEDMKNYLLDTYMLLDGKNTVQQLIAAQQNKSMINGKSISIDEALDEVVADGCEMMLKDSKAAQNLASENKPLASKISDWIKDFVEKVKKAFEGIGPNSREAQILSMYQDRMESIQKMWDDALVNAAKRKSVDKSYDNGKVAPPLEQSNSKNDDIRYSDRDSEGNDLTKEQQGFFKDSKVRDEQGRLLKVYHGTAADFTVFDRTKSRANMDIQGNFFSPLELDAKGYGSNVKSYYLDIKNPASESVAIKALNEFKGQNEAGIKAREYLESMGYDGVNYGNEEYIAFNSNQIKLATNTAPTSDADIRFSNRDYQLSEDSLIDRMSSDNVITPSILKKIGRQWISAFGSTISTDDFISEAKELIDTKGKSNLELSSILDDFTDRISTKIVDNSKIEIPNEEGKDLRKFFRGKTFTVSDDLYKELSYTYGSFNAYKQKMFGYGITIKKGRTSTFDTDWDEISGEFPYLFKADDNPMNMPNIVLDALDNSKGSQSMFSKNDDVYNDAVNSVKEGLIIGLSEAAIPAETNISTNREILTNAFFNSENLSVSDKNRVALYKSKLDDINAKQQKLDAINKKIHDTAFTSGTDRSQLEMLKSEAKTLASQISSSDKKLLSMEAMQPIQEILKRERSKAAESQKLKDVSLADQYRQRAEEKVSTIQQEYRDRISRDREKRKDTESKRNLRNRIVANVKNIDKILRSADNVKHVPDGFVKDTLSFMQMFTNDTSVFNRAQLDRVSAAYSKMAENGKLSDTNLSAFYDFDVDNDLKELSDTISGKRLSQLSESQLHTISDIVDHFKFVIKNENNLFFNNRTLELSKIGDDEIARLNKIKPFKTLVAFGSDVPGKMLNKANTFLLDSNTTPIYFFKRVGGAFKSLYDEIRFGQDTYAHNVYAADQFVRDTIKKFNASSWLWGNDKFQINTVIGDHLTITRQQALLIYSEMKREENNGQDSAHLMSGGVVYEDELSKATKDKKISFVANDKTAHPLSFDDLLKITGWLTDEQKGFADTMVKYLSNDMANLGNETSLKLFGIKKFTESYYIPFVSDKHFTQMKLGVVDDSRLKNMSFTKSTVKGASTPLVLSDFLSVVTNHINQMCMYNAFSVPLENMNRVMNYKTKTDYSLETKGESVSSAFDTAYGNAALKYINTLVKDVNGNAHKDSRENVFSNLIGKFKKGAVFASLSVAIQQPSAIGRALALVDPKYFIKTIATNRDWEECKKYNGVAIIKEFGGFDTGTGTQIVDWLSRKDYQSTSQKALALITDESYRDKKLSFAPEKADEITWCHIWNAVKSETKAKTGLSGAALLEKSAERFRDVIDYTQVYDSVLSRSEMMRSKSTMAKMATAFMAEPTLSYNMLCDAAIGMKEKGVVSKKYFIRAVAAYTFSMVLNSILYSLVSAARNDDDDETYIEKYFGDFSSNMLDALNPLTLLPIFKDVMSIVKGYNVERADMSLFSDVKDNFDNLKNDKLSMTDKIMGIVGSISAFAGIPVKNVYRDFVKTPLNVIGMIKSNTETSASGIERAIYKAVGIDLSSKSEYAQMVDGLSSGDKTKYQNAYDRQYTELVRKGDTDSEAKNKISAGMAAELRDTDGSIFEAAYSRMKGDTSTYENIVKAQMSKGYDKSTVISAINSARDKLTAAAQKVANKDSEADSDISSIESSGYKDARSSVIELSKNVVASDTSGNDDEDLFKTSDLYNSIASGNYDSVYKDLLNSKTNSIMKSNPKISNADAQNEAEAKLKTSLVSSVKSAYIDGKIDDDKANSYLMKYCGQSDSDSYLSLDKWKYIKKNGSDDGYSKFESLYQSMDDGEYDSVYGKLYDSEVQYRSENYPKESSSDRSENSEKYVQSGLSSRIRTKYLDGDVSFDGAYYYLTNYCGKSSKDAYRLLYGWNKSK